MKPRGAWDGNYHCNEGQRVSDRDARALGEALLRAADAITGNEVWLDNVEFRVGGHETLLRD